MINLRDLIYGTQEEQEEEEEEEEQGHIDELRGIGPFYGERPRITHPKRHRTTTEAQRREPRVHSEYLEGPEMLPENKDIPQFLPEYPSYYRFPQADKKDTTVHRETLRQVWNDACCGQDFDTAVKALMVMCEKSVVDFTDFLKFLVLLRSQPDITSTHLRTLAVSAIRSKLPPSTKTETAKALIHMFIQLFVADGDITASKELLNQFIGHPLMVQDPKLNSTLALLSCLEAIRFVHRTKPSVISLGKSKHSKPSASDDEDSAGSSTDDGSLNADIRNDIPDLKSSNIKSAKLCPSCGDVVKNPFQFFSTIFILKQYSEILPSKHINGISGSEIKRVFHRCCSLLSAAVENFDNSSCVDLVMLYVGMLEATGKPNEAHRQMKRLLRCHPSSSRVHRVYVQYLAMFRRSIKHNTMLKYLRKWLGRGNGLMERETSPIEQNEHLKDNVQDEGESSGDNEEETEMPLLRDYCNSGVYDRNMEEYQVGLYLQQLNLMTKSDILALSCDVVEALPPLNSMKSAAQGAECQYNSGYSDKDLVLWRHLARLLGPLPVKKGMDDVLSVKPSSEIIHSTNDLLPQTLQSGVIFDLKANKSHSDDDVLSGDIKSMEMFTSIPAKSLRSNHFIFSDFNSGDPVYNIEKELIRYFNDSGEVIKLQYLNDKVVGNLSSGKKKSKVYKVEDHTLDMDYIFRQKRKYWNDLDFMFQANDLGEGYCQTILETSAKGVIKGAISACRAQGDSEESHVTYNNYFSDDIVKPHKVFDIISKKHDTGNYKYYLDAFVNCAVNGVFRTPRRKKSRIKPVSVKGMRRKISGREKSDKLWNKLEDLCAEGIQDYSFIPEFNCVDNYVPEEIAPYSVRKVEGYISEESPLWMNVEKRKKAKMFRSGPIFNKEKHIFYKLGGKLLELLSYKVIVKCHLSGESDGLFAAKVAQVLIQQSECDIKEYRHGKEKSQKNEADHPTPSQLCISYLESMNFNVLRAIRIGNVLASNEVNPSVKPLVMCALPPEEELLMSSTEMVHKKRVLRTYRPV